MATLLVTGGVGSIGSNFVHQALTATDNKVVVSDALTSAGNPASLDDLPDDRIRLVIGNVCDRELVDDLLAASNARKLCTELGWEPRHRNFTERADGHNRVVSRQRILVAPAEGGHRGALPSQR